MKKPITLCLAVLCALAWAAEAKSHTYNNTYENHQNERTNLPPTIRGTSNLDKIKIGDPINFSAIATDTSGRLVSVKVFVKTYNERDFTAYPMNPGTDGVYRFDELVHQVGLTEYYYTATNDIGLTAFDGTVKAPYLIPTLFPFPVTMSPIAHRMSVSGFDYAIFNIWELDAKIGGETLEYLDVIGVFYTDTICDANNHCEVVERPAGSLIYEGFFRANESFLVYGDNPNTPAKEGLVEGEPFKYKLYRRRDNAVYDAEGTLRDSSFDFVFANGGGSHLASLIAFCKQKVALKKGGNYWSTYLEPKDPSFDVMMANEPSVTGISDDQQNSWQPGASNNTLTTYTPGKGYLVFMSANDEIEVEGNKLAPSSVSVQLNEGPKPTIIGCPYDLPENVENVFPQGSSSNINTIDKFIRLDNGNFFVDTYLPVFGINLWVDKNMNPGEAYAVRVISTDPNFTFPAPMGPFTRKAANPQSVKSLLPQEISAIERYMHVVLPAQAWKTMPAPESEVRAYNAEGKLVGQASINEQASILIIDGMKIKEDESFTLKLWSPLTNKASEIRVKSWSLGDGAYHNHEAAIVELAASEAEYSNGFTAYPNPVNGTLNVMFDLEAAQEVSLAITDIAGKVVKDITHENYEQGAHQLSVQTTDLTAGVYLLRIQKGKTIEIKKIIVSQ